MKNLYKFKYFNYDIFDNIITSKDISLAVNKFSKECLENSNDKFAIMFKVKTTDGYWRNISPIQIIDKNKINDLNDIFNIYWSYKSEYYHSMTISKIVFRYRYIESNISPNKCILNFPTDFDKKKSILPEGYTNLPNNRLFETWGNEIILLDDNTYKIIKDNHSFFVKCFDNEYLITLYFKDKKLLYFNDKYTTNSNNTFIRTIDNCELYYNNGNCNFLKQSLKTNYIKSKKTDLSIKNNFITMDLETRTINNEMHVIASSIFDGKKTKSFYLNDFNSSYDLLKESIMYLLQRKYLGYRVYLHNFSNFDATFMLRIMGNIENCEIERCIIRDGRIIDIKLCYNLEGKRKYSIYFRDSLLILPSSLKKLGDSFSVEIKKSIYPYKFVNNINVKLDYIGKIPSYKYFDNLEYKDYLNYCKHYNNKNWSLKVETLKYCENDVKSLYLIIKEFQKKIFRLFESDINNYPTLSSLAFAIYRMKYIKDYKIPIISGELYNNIKESYTGGSVDVYKPLGENIYRYDINSLYPSVMTDFPSPVGKIYKFKGNILDYDENPFGFFYVKVKSPEYLHIPILQTRIKTKCGIRTLSPLGEWYGWYFSEEIVNAKKYGYEFEIIWGYTFEKEFIFKDYVNDLYKLKKESERNSSTYIISKLLLNSLYGRFGMSPDKKNHVIIKGSYEIGKFITNEDYKDIDAIELDDNVELISYSKNNINEEEQIYDNISVSIASSITSYARIKMSEIKMKYSDNIYYSDTDSIDLDIQLPKEYISNNLGDFKFENKFKNVIYIAPKVYAAITDKGEEYIKIKGFKDNVNFEQISNVIFKDEKLILNQEKWYKNIKEGKILTKPEKYTLMVTENKRKLIYENNKLNKSIPYRLLDGKLI